MKYYSPYDCLKEYTSLQTLKSHLKGKHNIVATSKSQRTKQRKTIWDCAFCNKNTNNHTELAKHFYFVHGYPMNKIGVTSNEQLSSLQNAYKDRINDLNVATDMRGLL